MKALSAHSTHSDPYRAGAELTEGLRAIAPEVVFLFSSIHYGGGPDLAEAVLDGLDGEPLLVGVTGDGFCETGLSAEVGASALALSGSPSRRWELAWAEGASRDPAAAVRSCVETIRRRLGGDEPVLAFVVAGLETDGNLLVDAINDSLSCPVFGGLAGDDRHMRSSWIFANRRALQDGVAILAVAGELPFEVHVACGLTPVGAPGRITEASSRRLLRIGDSSAMSFVEAQTGKPISAIDKGITAFRVANPGKHDEAWHLSIGDFDEAEGSVKLFGGVEVGQEVQVCFAYPSSLIAAIEQIRQQAGRTRIDPVAGLIVSCAGRKWVLGHEIDREVKAAFSGVEQVFPIAGFLSFGEIAPMKRGDRYTRQFFHNVTYVLALLGDRE